jgi:prevent-host-death family protein
MEINIYDAKANFSKIIQMIADGTEDVIIISKNGKPTAQITRIAKKNSKRVGAAKKEMENFDITVESLDSIEIEDFGL